MKLASGAPEISITLSCGVATAEGSESIDSVLARADAALYRAKRAGRNRVVSAGTQRESESGRILLEAAARGTSEGLQLMLNVIAMLVSFVALVALLNGGFGAIHRTRASMRHGAV